MPKSRFRPLFALPATLLLMAVPLACGGNDSGEESGDSLTVYSGRTADLIEPLFEDFTEATGIEVEARYGDTAELAVTLVEEGDASPADLFISQDAGALGAVAEEGLLSEIPKPLLGKVEPRFHDDDGHWVGISGRARVIAFGEDVDEAEIPESVLELTDDEWDGRVGWAPTNGSLQAFITAMRGEYGDERTLEWIEGMVGNGTLEYESNTTVRDAIAAGEIDLGLINHYYVAQAKAEEGEDYPVDVHFPGDDLGSMINVAGVGVLASSEHNREALDLVEYMLGREAQSYFSESSKEYPLLDGVEADPSIPPLSEIPAPKIDLSSISDLNGTLELMREGGAL